MQKRKCQSTKEDCQRRGRPFAILDFQEEPSSEIESNVRWLETPAVEYTHLCYRHASEIARALGTIVAVAPRRMDPWHATWPVVKGMF